MKIHLTKVQQTCEACPSQWDAWDAGGKYYYLRYRFNRATVETAPHKDADFPQEWTPLATVSNANGNDDDPYAGYCTLEEFVQYVEDQVTITYD